MTRLWLVLLVLIGVSCGGDSTPSDGAAEPAGATRPTDVTTAGAPLSEPSQPSAPGPTDAPGVVPEGFGTIAALVTASDGETCELCLWLAADDASRGRGLMQVTDLGGLDGMAFRYDDPHTTSFTMRNTVMPLSIAFFGADGALLDAFDMEPCVAEPCPSYPTPADFVVAIEGPRGGLPDLEIHAGSMLELRAEGCSATAP